MFIERKKELTPVQDFMQNVQIHISGDKIPYEIYDNGEVIGWKIEDLRKV